MAKVVKIISFRDTALFKRGVLLSAVALVASVVAPATRAGSWSMLAPTLVASALMLALCTLALARTRIHRFADEVMDCENQLKVRRGRTEVTVPIGAIHEVKIASAGVVHRITLELRMPIAGASRVDFLPQASLWSNRAALEALAAELTARARQASPLDHRD